MQKRTDIPPPYLQHYQLDVEQGIAILNARGEWQWISPRFCQFLGYSPEALSQTSVMERLDSQSHTLLKIACERLRGGLVGTPQLLRIRDADEAFALVELRTYHAQGGQVYLSLTACGMGYGYIEARHLSRVEAYLRESQWPLFAFNAALELSMVNSAFRTRFTPAEGHSPPTNLKALLSEAQVEALIHWMGTSTESPRFMIPLPIRGAGKAGRDYFLIAALDHSRTTFRGVFGPLSSGLLVASFLSCGELTPEQAAAQISEALLLTDAGGTCYDYNGRALARWRGEADGLMAARLSTLLRQGDIEAMAATAGKSLRIFEWRDASGQLRMLFGRLLPVSILGVGEGALLSFFETGQGIPHREGAEPSEREQARSSAGTWVWTVQNGEMEWSDSLYRLLDLDPGIQPNLAQLMRSIEQSDKATFLEMLSMTRMGRELPFFQCRLLTKNREIRPMDCRLEILSKRGDMVLKIAGHFQDISIVQGMEGALRVANRRLKDTNSELSQFVYVASHDLQEPLRKISTFSQLLDEKYAERLDEDGRRYIRYNIEAAQRMQSLIKDLLAYSRVDQVILSPARVNTQQVVSHLLDALELEIEECEAQIHVGPLPPVLCERTALYQLFHNLVVNALKYRGKKAPEIEVRAQEAEGFIHFFITDNGLGIAPEYHDRIFDVFQRLHDRSEYPGTGIGLAICKKIVARSGGEIGVQSELGAGSVFHFSLPKALAPNA